MGATNESCQCQCALVQWDHRALHLAVSHDAGQVPTQISNARKVPYYTIVHTTPHTTLHVNKNRQALRQRKCLRLAVSYDDQVPTQISKATPSMY
jgi:hypothetical protein